jgi:hypothetical protein
MHRKGTAEQVPPGAEPYERLAELAEAELALCEAGRFEELGGGAVETEAIVASLPPRPPADAREPLERAARAQNAIAALLARGVEDTRGELVQLRRGRDAARSYAANAAR